MRKTVLSYFFALVVSTTLSAQYHELGVFLGTSNYSGELQSKFHPSEYNLSFGVFGRKHFTKYWAAKVHFYKGDISGTDANQQHKGGLRQRNLNFRSSLIEAGIQGEYNLTPFAIREKRFSTVFLFAGVSGFYFNPQAQMNGQWYELQPLGTEGQGSDLYPDRKKYSRFNVAIPMGLGIRLNVNEKSTFGFEIGFRKTFTDYLDDVSTTYPDIDYLLKTNPIVAYLSYREPDYVGTPLDNPVGQDRGDASKKDWYMFTGFTFSVNLIDDKYDLEWEEKYKIFKERFDD